MKTDAMAMAAVNLFGVLGTMEELCRLDEPSKEILKQMKKPYSLCFQIKDGPCATLCFSNEGVTMKKGTEGCNGKMRFSSPEAFNNLIDNSKPGFPAKDPIGTIAFLLGTFSKLANRLTEILRPSEEAMKDRGFFELNTRLTLFTVAGAISALANYDPISRISAKYTTNGDVSFGVKGDVAATIRIRDGKFETIKKRCKNPTAILEFADLDLAASLFGGTASTFSELCAGRIKMAGMLSMVDNVNRILDRVSDYLAG